MASEKVNEIVAEFRYPPNARVLDRRGEWAAILSKAFELKEWAIDNSSIRLMNKEQSRLLCVGFRNSFLFLIDSESQTYFSDLATKMVRSVFSLDGFGSPTIDRIGVRSKFGTPFTGKFPDLVKRFARNYAVPTDRALKVFPPSARLIDIGSPLNFEDEDGFFNTTCGPMERNQMKQFFSKSEGFPEVGLYFEIDYFRSPSLVMTADELSKTITDFAFKSWDFHDRVNDAVLKG